MGRSIIFILLCSKCCGFAFSPGLPGWMTSGDVRYIGNGEVLLTEDHIPAGLWSDFLVPDNAISFTYRFWDDYILGQDDSQWPENSDLLKTSIIGNDFSTVFVWSPDYGIVSGDVTLLGVPGSAAGGMITMDISQYAGQDARIEFMQEPYLDGLRYLTYIGDLDITVVPLPSTLLLCIVGIAFLRKVVS